MAATAEIERANAFRTAAANLLNSNILTAEAAESINAAVDSISNPSQTPAVSNVPLVSAQNQNGLQVYTMSRSSTSVTDIWREYDVGLNGQRSIRQLDSEFKARWRNSERDRSFYRSSKVFYSAIENLASSLVISPLSAAKRMETFRIQQNLTLAQFREQLKTNGSRYYIDSVTNIADD
jgi:hypothetical protein